MKQNVETIEIFTIYGIIGAQKYERGNCMEIAKCCLDDRNTYYQRVNQLLDYYHKENTLEIDSLLSSIESDVSLRQLALFL